MEIFNSILKKGPHLIVIDKLKKFKILSLNPLLIFSSIVLISIIFFTLTNLNTRKNIENRNNLKIIKNSKEFNSFTNLFINKIQSPYKEIKYTIQNNDTVEKILKKFDIKSNEINTISTKLKRKKLSNIYSGRELSLVIKRSANSANTLVNLLYPVNNTSSIEVRKYKDDFIIKENILKLYKKEVVIKNEIKNNLYNSAIQSKIEPNIIVEFARIFGFEVDFQRDIRKGD